MVSRRFYEILGVACGFVLIDYGFSLVAAGFPGARELTSQFLGANFLVGGSVAVFISLYYLLRPGSVAAPTGTQPTSPQPDVEEAKLTVPLAQPKLYPENLTPPVTIPATPSPSLPNSLEVHMGDFTRLPSGEYERHLSGEAYDMFRMEQEGVTVWREDRKGMRSVYLAGPYELSRKLLEDGVKDGEELKIGCLNLSVDSMRDFLAVLERPPESAPSASS